MITQLVMTSYWTGVLVGFVVILLTIFIYKSVIVSPYGEQKSSPFVLLLLIFSFLSWYVVVIITLIFVIVGLVWLIKWIIWSFFHDFFPNNDDMV